MSGSPVTRMSPLAGPRLGHQHNPTRTIATSPGQVPPSRSLESARRGRPAPGRRAGGAACTRDSPTVTRPSHSRRRARAAQASGGCPRRNGLAQATVGAGVGAVWDTIGSFASEANGVQRQRCKTERDGAVTDLSLPPERLCGESSPHRPAGTSPHSCPAGRAARSTRPHPPGQRAIQYPTQAARPTRVVGLGRCPTHDGAPGSCAQCL